MFLIFEAKVFDIGLLVFLEFLFYLMPHADLKAACFALLLLLLDYLN